MKNCTSCNSVTSDEKMFCEECGKAFEVAAPIQVEPMKQQPPVDPVASNALTLRTWKPWRWLFTEKYGELAISDGNFSWNLFPSWRHPAIKIVSQVFSYGFHILGYLNNNGFSPIKNVNAIFLVSPQWIKWRFTFLIINSGGFVGLYPVPEEDLEKAKAFKQSLRDASSENK